MNLHVVCVATVVNKEMYHFKHKLLHDTFNNLQCKFIEFAQAMSWIMHHDLDNDSLTHWSMFVFDETDCTFQMATLQIVPMIHAKFYHD